MLATRKPKSKQTRTAGISNEAVKKATGRTWGDWSKLLDKHGCKAMPHKEIAALIGKEYGVGPWWRQMVTVGYEQAKGLRKVHETPRGFQASVSRTISAPVASLFNAWTTTAARKRWLEARSITIRKSTRNKSLRITCSDDTAQEVNFYPKSAARCQISIQHGKLRNEREVVRSKKIWSAALEKLKTMTASVPRQRFARNEGK